MYLELEKQRRYKAIDNQFWIHGIDDIKEEVILKTDNWKLMGQ